MPVKKHTKDTYVLPKWLYASEEASDQVQLTSMPTGKPNLEAFIQQSSEWWETEGGERLKPKTIIIHDQSLPNRYYKDVQDLLEKMLEEGFEIYVWNKEFDSKVLTKLTIDTLYKIYEMEIRLTTKSELNTIATILNKSADQIQTLDYFDIQQLRFECTHAIEEDELGLLDVRSFIGDGDFEFKKKDNSLTANFTGISFQSNNNSYRLFAASTSKNGKNRSENNSRLSLIQHIIEDCESMPNYIEPLTTVHDIFQRNLLSRTPRGILAEKFIPNIRIDGRIKLSKEDIEKQIKSIDADQQLSLFALSGIPISTFMPVELKASEESINQKYSAQKRFLYIETINHFTSYCDRYQINWLSIIKELFTSSLTEIRGSFREEDLFLLKSYNCFRKSENVSKASFDIYLSEYLINTNEPISINLPALVNLKLKFSDMQINKNLQGNSKKIDLSKNTQISTLELNLNLYNKTPISIIWPPSGRLRHLTLAGDNNEIVDALSSLKNLSNDIHKLVLTGSYNDSSSSARTIPLKWNKLEQIQVTGSLPEECLFNILDNSPNIKSICLATPHFGFYLNKPSFSGKEALESEKIEHASRYIFWLEIIRNKRFKKYLPLLDSKTKESIRIIIDLEKLEKESEQNEALNSLEQTSSSNLLSNLDKKEATGDIDTSSKHPTYNIKRVFFAKEGSVHPIPEHLRSNIYSELVINPNPFTSVSSPYTHKSSLISFVNCPSEPLRLQSAAELIELRDTFKSESAACYYGYHVLQPTNEWQPLPSMSHQERISSIHVEGIHSSNYQLVYSEDDNRYYLRILYQSRPRTVHFTVEVPNRLSTSKNLPKEVTNLIQHIQSFGEGTLELKPGKYYNGEDFLNEFFKQRVGACRHRAAVFAYKMNKEFPTIPVRVIENLVHAFVEAQYNGEWITIDLGGYPSNINIIDTSPMVDNFDDILLALKASSPPTGGLNDLLTPPETDEHFQNLRSEDELNPIFKTWNQDATACDTALAFNQALLRNTGSKLLVQTPSTLTDDYQLSIQDYCVKTGRPVFYVHSPKDLICSGNWIERDLKNNTGKLMKGPGGPLYEFLQANKESSPVIIVNWNNFKAEHIVQFNGLIDEHREADGVAVPSQAIIVGIYDTDSPDAYIGADFHSRMDKKIKLPFNQDELKSSSLIHTRLKDTPMSEASSASRVTIDLHQSANWKSLLVGQWTLQGEQLLFVEGPLTTALRAGKPIHIHNAPWHLADFQRFWETALLHKNISLAGEIIRIPDSVQFTRSEGFQWMDLAKAIHWLEDEQAQPGPVFVLNPSTLSRFLGTYSYENELLYKTDGILKQFTGKIIAVELTRSLSQAAWSELLSKAAEFKVTLSIHPRDGMTLPEGMPYPSGMTLVDGTLKSPLSSKAFHSPSLYHCKDVDAALAQLKAGWLASGDLKEIRVIDITELKTSSLLYAQIPHWNKDLTTFKFEQVVSDVYKELQAGKRIVLKGAFSSELMDAVSELISHNAQLPSSLTKQPSFGDLVLISTSEASKGLMHSIDLSAAISPEAKASALQSVSGFSREEIKTVEPFLPSTGYAALESMLAFHRSHPGAESEAPWEGLKSLPRADAQAFTESIDLSQEASDTFEHERTTLLENTLSQAPFAFIAGVTGVGKSSFIRTALKKDQRYVVYNELKDVKAWAEDTSDATKVLFIDEANIGSTNYSQFEGLFDTPPWLLIDHKVTPLSPRHKIIFAGNPLSYGGDRHLPSLFANHGNSIVFKPMPPAYLYHKILNPVFEDDLKEEQKQALALIILKTYEIVVGLNPETVLISPRELQMMAISIMSGQTRDRDSMTAKAYEVSYTIAKGVLPQPLHKTFDNKFHEAFGFPGAIQTKLLPDRVGTFVLTPSRHEPYRQMNELLEIRNYQINQARSEAAKFGGLGGIILQGEPGTGKSKFVIQMLTERGFRKGSLNHIPRPGEQIFYKIPVSMSQKEKEAYILKAFHEGSVVLMDEINSCGMMEKFMNAVLNGQDMDGNPPNNPGFKIIGTENPISFKGRKARSLALQRRLISSHFSEYPHSELVAILENMGLNNEHSIILSKDFLEAKAFALKHNKNPIPVFRDLSRQVERTLEANARSLSPSSSTLEKLNFTAVEDVTPGKPVGDYDSGDGRHSPGGYLPGFRSEQETEVRSRTDMIAFLEEVDKILGLDSDKKDNPKP